MSKNYCKIQITGTTVNQFAPRNLITFLIQLWLLQPTYCAVLRISDLPPSPPNTPLGGCLIGDDDDDVFQGVVTRGDIKGTISRNRHGQNAK